MLLLRTTSKPTGNKTIMTRFNQNEFIKFIWDQEVIGFYNEEITLKSGQKSNFYINRRNITEDVFSLEILADHLLDFIKSEKKCS